MLDIGKEQLRQNLKNGLVKKILVLFILVKTLSTFGAMFLYGLYEYLIGFSSFSIFFVFSSMFDDTIAEKYGLIIIIFLGIYSLVWAISLVFVHFKNKIAFPIGFIGIMSLNACDMICCSLSYFQIKEIYKIINLAFSFTVILVSFLVLKLDKNKKTD